MVSYFLKGLRRMYILIYLLYRISLGDTGNCKYLLTSMERSGRLWNMAGKERHSNCKAFYTFGLKPCILSTKK